jgi:hypothetical protein
MVGSRFHSMSKTGASNAAAVYIEPAANYQEVVIAPFDSDDSLTTFSGFAGMLNISGLINKARGTGVDLSATGHSASAIQRSVYVNVQYRQNNPTTVVASAVKADNSLMSLTLDGCISFGSGGHGFDIACTSPQIIGCIVHNAGQETTNTYDGFNISGTNAQLTGCTAYQDQTAGVAINKARWAFNTNNALSIDKSCVAIGAFATGAISPLSLLSIANSGGTKVYTLTFDSSTSSSQLQIFMSGTMGGTFTKSVSKLVSIGFGLASNTLYDSEVIVLSELGDATGADVVLSVAAVGASNQVTLTITNNNATDTFSGEIDINLVSNIGGTIISFA